MEKVENFIGDLNDISTPATDDINEDFSMKPVINNRNAKLFEMMESLEAKREKSSSAKMKVNLDKYMGNLHTFQKKTRDPNNRVNIPYYRRIARMRYSERN